MAHTSARRRTRCTGDLVLLLLGIAARTTLATVFLLAVWAALPAALDWRVTTVVSDSMAPAVRTGDVVAAMPIEPGTASVGQVLLVEDPDHEDRQRLHRLERIETDGALRLRGDANPEPDRTAVDADTVLGVGVLRFPVVGLPSVWLRSGDWVQLAATGLGVIALVLLGRVDRDLRTGVPCRRCGTPRWDLHTTVVRTGPDAPGGTSLALPLAATVALVAIAATTAGAGFSGSTTSDAALGTTDSFPCFHRGAAGAALAWDFAERGGSTALDSSGNGRDGLLGAGAARTNGSCTENPFVTFSDGSSQSAVVHTTSSTTAPPTFAVELWFRTDRPQGRLFGFTGTPTGTTGAYDRNFYVGTDGRLVFGVWDTSVAKVVESPGRIDDGTWHHAVGQFTAGRLELHVDGVLAASRTDVLTAVSYIGYWRAGHGRIESTWPNPPTDPTFVGAIDSVRVHHGTLSPAQITARFAAGR